MRTPFVLGLGLRFASPTLQASHQNGQVDKKQLETRAKQLIAEGNALEKQVKLDEAGDRYADSLGVVSKNDALNAVKDIAVKDKQQVD